MLPSRKSSSDGAEHVGPYLLLHELGHELAAREQVRQREVRQLRDAEPAHEPIGERHDPVRDDHRPLDQQRLEARGARSREDDVGRRDHLARASA